MGSPTALEPSVRQVLANVDPQLVMFHPATLDDVIGQGAAQRRFTTQLLLTFALVALALSALGLFGVLAYGVKLRSREFGIRMALGAGRRSIGAMVLRQGLTVVSVGVAIGLAASLLLSKLIQALLFQVSPLDPRVFAAAIGFMAVVAGVAAWFPAHRATGVDPRSALQ